MPITMMLNNLTLNPKPVNTKTLHSFQLLPREIRIQIWQLAIAEEKLPKVLFVDLAMNNECFCAKHVMHSHFRLPRALQVNREAREVALLNHNLAFQFTRASDGQVFPKQHIHPRMSTMIIRFHSDRQHRSKVYDLCTYSLLFDLISPSIDPTSPWFGTPIDFQIRIGRTCTYVRIKKATEDGNDGVDGITVTGRGAPRVQPYKGLLDWNQTWEAVRQQMVLEYPDRTCEK
ncbi:hypothetical protein BP6252_08515 [Coleophoma cylindrospora]|uniref:2EXR domain-containing protein n=1 Tax=Coleophoma cylindrospora TaxID=1849047 RepID=A0A3D8R624_9HELO|nr:hypothetical protein BP6252_08515 [Coleophoma cylindrospora]